VILHPLVHQTMTSFQSLLTQNEMFLISVKRLLSESGALFRWARVATVKLRKEILELQHDAELVQMLLFPLLNDDGRISDGGKLLFERILSGAQKVVQDFILPSGLAYIAQRFEEETPSRRIGLHSLLPEIQDLLEQERMKYIRSFNRMWMEHRIVLNQLDPPVIASGHLTQEPRLNLLSNAMQTTPFAVGSTRDRFIQYTPNTTDNNLHLDQYQYLVREISGDWAKIRFKMTPTEKRLNAHKELLNLIWNGTLEALRNVSLDDFASHDAIIEDYNKSLRVIHSSTRDALIRSATPTFSMVLVGGEDAGKSTFLNAMIGSDLLPSSGESFLV
jgi:hypothetical protein